MVKPTTWPLLFWCPVITLDISKPRSVIVTLIISHGLQRKANTEHGSDVGAFFTSTVFGKWYSL